MSRRSEGSLLALLIVAVSCRQQGKTPTRAVPPASVSGARPERELATVTLTAEAEKRLGVEVAPAERRQVSRALTLGGEVVVPPGQSLTVTAPVAGTILMGGTPPAPGSTLRRGQVVLRLAPLPSAAELASAEVRLEAARKKRERAGQLLAGGAGTRRNLEEAEAELTVAENNARAGRTGSAADGAATIRITCPQTGVLRDLRVGPGQNVVSGAPLFQVDGSSRLWVRVPVYAGDAAGIDRTARARIERLSDRRPTAGLDSLDGTPVMAPPSANPDAASVDVFYLLPADTGAAPLSPGQKVRVTIPLRDAAERLVVPWSAVLYDVLGGAWVYVRSAPREYTRRRVEVDYLAGERAVLERGPQPGTEVVKVGAAEIFGTEFGTQK